MKKGLPSRDSRELAIGQGERADREVNGQYPTQKVGDIWDRCARSRCFKQIVRNLGVLRFVSLADHRRTVQRASEENQLIMKLQSWIVGAIAAVVLLAASPLKAQSDCARLTPRRFSARGRCSLESPQGPFEQVLELKDAGGKVSGQLTSPISPDPTVITDIAKDGEDLVLKFNGDFQGTAFTAKLTLDPAGHRQGQGLVRHHGWSVRDGRDGGEEVIRLGIQNLEFEGSN